MTDFGIEDLDKVLIHKNITVSQQPYTEAYFERTRIIEVNNKTYKIEWWINICYLYYGDLTIPFKYVKQSNTWPHNAKTNLQFYDDNDRVCCILRVED